MTGDRFESAPYHEADDPLERLLAYVAFRKELIQGEVPEFTCLKLLFSRKTIAQRE